MTSETTVFVPDWRTVLLNAAAPVQPSSRTAIRTLMELNANYALYPLLFSPPLPTHVLVDFVVLPPGHGSSVTRLLRLGRP